MLKLAENLKLQVDAATETFAILGRRGSGKTHTAVVMAEEMLGAGVQVVVIDPLDVWWGLRVSKDGKSAGIPIYVAGGTHQDIPLVADAGKVLADVVVDKGLSVVLSLRHLSKTDQRRFVGDFGERLYDRKGEDRHRTALHVFIDEADAFVPQRLMPGSERCFGAIDTLVRRGRSSGIAPTLISQRPQVINKDVLSQTEVLVAHQLTGPQDRKALEAWIEAHDTENQSEAFMASLASLPKGTAWFWSPGMLDVFRKVTVRDRRTFDSSATPKPGAVTAKPKAFAAVDLEAITAEVKATIEKAKADDPKELRKQLVEVKRQLAQKDATLAEVDVRTKRIDEKLQSVAHTKRDVERAGKVAELKAELVKYRRALEEAMKILVKVKAVDFSTRGGAALEEAVTAAVKQITSGIEKRVSALAERVHGIQAAASAAEAAIQKLLDEKIDLAVTVQKQAPFAVTTAPRTLPARPPRAVEPSVEGITPAKQRILNALAFLEGIGLQKGDKGQVALLADAKPTSGAFRNNIGALRTAGLIDYPTPGAVALTDAGRAIANSDGVPTTTEDLHQAIKAKLPPAKWRIVEAAIEAYPHALAKEDLAARAGAEPTSGAFRNNVSSLRTLGVIDYPRAGEVKASPVLFLEG